jgi:TolA-binding protein
VKLVAAVIAVAVIAAIAFGGWYYINSQDEKASAELSTAVRTFETPVRPAGVPAQPGYDSFGSSQERATAARKQFQSIVDKYPRTHTADMARYFVGLTSSQVGDNAGAERNLQEASSSGNADLAALGKFALASVYRSENKDSQAVDLYKQLIDKPTLVVSKATAQLELAGYYESRQKPDEAKKIYDQVEKENPSTEAASLAQRRAAALKQ